MLNSTVGVFTVMEMVTILGVFAGLVITIAIALMGYWLKRFNEKSDRAWEKLDNCVTREDMKEYVELAQRPVMVKLEVISAEIRGVRAAVD